MDMQASLFAAVAELAEAGAGTEPRARVWRPAAMAAVSAAVMARLRALTAGTAVRCGLSGPPSHAPNRQALNGM